MAQKITFPQGLIINKELKVTESKYTLVVVSSPYCSFCRKAKKQFISIKEFNNLQIVIYSFDGAKVNKDIYGNTYFKSFLFIDADKDTENRFSRDFFSSFFLYSNEAQIWKGKGIKKNTIKKIIHKIEKSK
jgi:thioredoxin-related protein